MTLSEDRHQALNEIVEDIMESVEYIEGVQDKYEDDEDYKNGDQKTKLATERVVAGLRQHMVNACREILDHEIGQKPNKRKEAVKMCMDEGLIQNRKGYTEAFSFGEKTAKVYGRNVDDVKMYSGLDGLPSTYREFSSDILDYISNNSEH